MSGSKDKVVRALVRLSRLEAEERLDAKETAEEDKRAILADLPGDIVALYQSVARKGRHPVAVPLANGYCSACHLKLTPQLANAVAGRGEIARCPHCQRLLYDPRGLDR